MPHYTYLIVGGGMTGDAAIHGIREVDRNGSIGLIGAELHPPYNRPPLSKGLWKGDPLESIWPQTDNQGVTYARTIDKARHDCSDSWLLGDAAKLGALDPAL